VLVLMVLMILSLLRLLRRRTCAARDQAYDRNGYKLSKHRSSVNAIDVAS
jgi:hypothetical protein